MKDKIEEKEIDECGVSSSIRSRRKKSKPNKYREAIEAEEDAPVNVPSVHELQDRLKTVETAHYKIMNENELLKEKVKNLRLHIEDLEGDIKDLKNYEIKFDQLKESSLKYIVLLADGEL